MNKLTNIGRIPTGTIPREVVGVLKNGDDAMYKSLARRARGAARVGLAVCQLKST